MTDGVAGQGPEIWIPVEAWRAASPRPRTCKECGHGRGLVGPRRCGAPGNVTVEIDLVSGEHKGKWPLAADARRDPEGCGLAGAWWVGHGQTAGAGGSKASLEELGL